jgi:hypothetical protein
MGRAPGLSLSGVRLIIPDHALGASCVARAFLADMLPPAPLVIPNPALVTLRQIAFRPSERSRESEAYRRNG